MSHPDPTNDGKNYKEDKVTHYPKKKGAMIKSLTHLVTKDHKASIKAGRKNRKVSEKILKMAKKHK